MKKMISWLLAAMLVSSCGTAPHADLRGESHMTTGSEEEQEGSEMAHYLIGGVIVVAAFCTLGGNAALKVCRKHFMSAEGFKKKIGDAATKLGDSKAGKSTDEVANIDNKITNHNKTIGLDKDGKPMTGDDAVEVKNGIFFTAYDKTIGNLVRKIKKKDGEADEAANSADEATSSADEAANSADEAGQQADEATNSTDSSNK